MEEIVNERIKEYSTNHQLEGLLELTQQKTMLNPYLRLILLQISKNNSAYAVQLANEYSTGILLKQNETKALKILQRESLKEDNNANYHLGWHYYEMKEFMNAIECFQKCLSETARLLPDEVANCYANIGDCYLKIARPDYAKAVEYLNFAVDKYKMGYAAYRLGSLYADANVKSLFDPEVAIKFLKKAVEYGSEPAAVELAEYYAFGKEDLGLNKDKANALQIMRPFFDSLKPDTLETIARIYLIEDDSLTSDYDNAKLFLQKALENNNGVFKNGYLESKLGYVLCLLGEDEEGIKYLIIADENGFQQYDAIIGRAYFEGQIHGIQQNHVLAEKYFHKAFNLESINMFQCVSYIELLTEGNPAVRNYEMAYKVAEYGYETFRDVEFSFMVAKLILEEKVRGKISIYEAVERLEATATFDSKAKEATFLLGNYYLKSKDYRKAESSYLKSFENGNAEAALAVARLYENGGGTITANISKGVEWYEKAASAGSKVAEDELLCFSPKLFGGYKRVRNLNDER